MLLPLDDKFRRDHREVQRGLQPVVRLLHREGVDCALDHCLRRRRHAASEKRPVQAINKFGGIASIGEPEGCIKINPIRFVKSDATITNQAREKIGAADDLCVRCILKFW